MSRSIVTKSGEDRFYTPRELAKLILSKFNITDSYLEPCFGSGSFYDQVEINKDFCEIDLGKDFLTYSNKVNWIVTNPPFSLFRPFLSKCLEVANNIVFLCPINHFTTKARINLILNAGFYIKHIYLLNETPKEFPTSGFQWGAVYITKGSGLTKIERLT